MGLKGINDFLIICDERFDNMECNWRVIYEHGHPEGWTDDLGIIADRNQWVKELLPGWYARQYQRGDRWWESAYHRTDLREWCEKNLTGYWEMPPDGYLYMSSEEDAVLFKLIWT